MNIGLSSVGKLYVVSARLRNALNYLYGNQTSAFFWLDLNPTTTKATTSVVAVGNN